MANFRQALSSGNGTYVIWFMVIYAGILLCIAGFNTIVAPFMIFRGDPMPDRIIYTLIRPYFEKAVSRKNFNTYLIGTSKTEFGFDTRPHKFLFNGGINGASMGRTFDYLNHLLAKCSQQTGYFVEVTGSINENKKTFNMLESILGADTTMGNIRRLLMSGKDYFDPNLAYQRVTKLTERELKNRGETAPISKDYQKTVQSMLKITVSNLAETRSAIVFYIPPHHPESLKHKKVIQTIAELDGIWKKIFHNLKLESNPDVRFINLSGADGFWSAHGDEGPQNNRHWFDLTHFDPIVGNLILKELFSNTPGARRPFIANTGNKHFQ